MKKINWQAPEFIKYEKSPSWFAVLWIISLGLIAVAIITKSLFMAILVVVAALVVSLYGAKEPKIIDFSLDEDSFSMDDNSYNLDSLVSFWIEEKSEEFSTLILASKRFKPHLSVLLPKEHVGQARLILRSHLEEEKHEESLVEALAEWLKF